MSEDLNIFYYGGSGGFYLLHQLLMNDEFICFFGDKLNDFSNKDYYSFIRNKNFNIKKLEEWKDTEIWPRNNVTKLIKIPKPKIYFTCNLTDEWLNFTGKKIFLYTDLKSQIRLTINKRANIFMPNNIKSH